jgi:hypothetical protein
VVASPSLSCSRWSKSSSNAKRVLGRTASDRIRLGLGFEFADEVVEIVVELLRLPGVDTLKGGFCKTNAICNTFVYSMDIEEDVTGGDRMMTGSLRVVLGRGRGVITPLESVFRELDALGDIVIHTIYPGD